MKPRQLILAGLIVLFGTGTALCAPLTDAQIKQRVIQQSIAAYPGPCACPYNFMRNGRSCGRRSAYSQPGGYAPLCYPADVTPDMVAAYRRSHPNQ